MGNKNDKVPVAMLDGSCVWMPSKDAAALSALDKLPYDSKEYAGAIYKNENGEFCYSVPVPGTNDNFQFKTDKSGGFKFDGIYHSHPGGRHDEDRFSHNDVTVADQLKRTSYIRANDSGEVKRYDPGVSLVNQEKRTGRPGEYDQTSAGTSIGNLKRQQLAELLRKLNPEPAEPRTDVAMLGQALRNGSETQ